MKLRTISELGNIAGKYVLLRDDFNTQIVDGKVNDTFRIAQSLPTIRALQEKGARIAILAHLGRPDGVATPKYSLRPVALALGELLGESVPLISDCVGAPAADARKNMQNGDVALLENVRFHAGEEENDSEFAAQLARGFDIFVNDAFSVSHRAHASTVGVTKFLPSFAGELLASEISAIARAMENPTRPLMGIIGSAKLDTKIKVLESLVAKCDVLAICGGLGTTFLLATGKYNFTDMLYKPEYKEVVERILHAAKRRGCKILLPLDKGVGPEYSATAPRTDKPFADITDGDIIMDDGPESVAQYSEAIDGAKTVILNGTLGLAEWQPNWSISSFALARYIARRTQMGKLESIVGGGDAAASATNAGVEADMTYVSTGGGAFLEFIEGKELPGIVALSSTNAVGG
ncbi:MAG: phosphoglycerate kinase [Proteobacteria bacterium]|nr:phosphoglycerate kinase [Pseudomonadota bacterium]